MKVDSSSTTAKPLSLHEITEKKKKSTIKLENYTPSNPSKSSLNQSLTHTLRDFW